MTFDTKELVTNDDPNVALCTLEGTEHDYRSYTYRWMGTHRTSWRCVWCHAVACGDIGQTDPCIEPHHHTVDHRTRLGVTWPIGGMRP